MIRHGKESGIWAFSMADIDPSLFGFFGVVATGVIAYRETDKGNGSATSGKNPSQASGALGMVDESALFTAQTSAPLLRGKSPSDVPKLRIDLSQTNAQPGDTVALWSGATSFGKTVLTQSEVAGKLVDLQLSSPLNDQHSARVLLTKANGTTDADTVVIDVNLSAGMQGAQTGSANELWVATWHDAEVALHTATAVTGHRNDAIL